MVWLASDGIKVVVGMVWSKSYNVSGLEACGGVKNIVTNWMCSFFYIGVSLRCYYIGVSLRNST